MARVLITYRKNYEVGMVFDYPLATNTGGQMITFTTGRNFRCNSASSTRSWTLAKTISDRMGKHIAEGMMHELKNNLEQPGFRANFFLHVKVKHGVNIEGAITDILDIVKEVCGLRVITRVEKK